MIAASLAPKVTIAAVVFTVAVGETLKFTKTVVNTLFGLWLVDSMTGVLARVMLGDGADTSYDAKVITVSASVAALDPTLPAPYTLDVLSDIVLGMLSNTRAVLAEVAPCVLSGASADVSFAEVSVLEFEVSSP